MGEGLSNAVSLVSILARYEFAGSYISQKIQKSDTAKPSSPTLPSKGEGRDK